jgi:hypothetical protein
MTIMKHYPRWVYHFSADPKIVESQEEFESLSEGWELSPAHVKPPPAPGEDADEDALASASKPKRKKK